MNGKFLWILSAMLISSAVAFASLHAQFNGKRPSTGQHAALEPLAQRDTALPQKPTLAAASVAPSTHAASALEERIRQMQRELDNLKHQRDSNTAPESSPAAPMQIETEAQERERTMKTTAFLQDNFVAEAKDTTWSLQAERQVSDTFNSDEISSGSQLDQLSCQSTLCRIESHHSDPNAERAFLTRLGRLESFVDAEAFSERVEQADGSIAAVTYVSRNGHRLPRME